MKQPRNNKKESTDKQSEMKPEKPESNHIQLATEILENKEQELTEDRKIRRPKSGKSL